VTLLNVSDRFCTTSGVRQECVLSPALFCHAINWILHNMTCHTGVAVGIGRFTDLDNVNDIVLPANTHAELAPCLTDFSLSARSMGLNVSWTKKKVQCLSRSVPTTDLHVQCHVVESVDRFCYLGSVQDSNGRSGSDILYVGSRDLVHERTFQSVVTKKAVSEHKVAHL